MGGDGVLMESATTAVPRLPDFAPPERHRTSGRGGQHGQAVAGQDILEDHLFLNPRKDYVNNLPPLP